RDGPTARSNGSRRAAGRAAGAFLAANRSTEGLHVVRDPRAVCPVRGGDRPHEGGARGLRRVRPEGGHGRQRGGRAPAPRVESSGGGDRRGGGGGVRRTAAGFFPRQALMRPEPSD